MPKTRRPYAPEFTRPAGRGGLKPLGRNHSGCSGRIARLLTGRALAVLLCAALFGFHTPAHAQTEVWSATLTVGENSSVGFLFRGYDASHHSGSLSDDQFEHKGVTYTILILNHAVDGPLWFGTDATGADALGNHNNGVVLEIGSTGFFLEKHQFGKGTLHHWVDPGLSWNVGDVIPVRLTVAHAQDAPALPSLTATIREQDGLRAPSSGDSFAFDFTWRPGQQVKVHYQLLTP